jgi:hypothetical protein
MGRRGSSDTRWLESKKLVRTRDSNSCRLLRIITAKQYMLLRKRAGSLLSQLDVAHIHPVSKKPEMMYETCNMVLLNRYSHSMLDSYRDPIKGDPISYEEAYDWWKKIVGDSQWVSLENVIEARYHG